MGTQENAEGLTFKKIGGCRRRRREDERQRSKTGREKKEEMPETTLPSSGSGTVREAQDEREASPSKRINAPCYARVPLFHFFPP